MQFLTACSRPSGVIAPPLSKKKKKHWKNFQAWMSSCPRRWRVTVIFLSQNNDTVWEIIFSMTSIITDWQTYTFVYGPAEGRFWVREFLAALKAYGWPSTVVCSMVGLLFLWHIPYFHSQFYYLEITLDLPTHICNLYKEVRMVAL